MNDEIEIEELAPWLVLFVTLAGFWLRVMRLDYLGLEMDETFNMWLAGHTMQGILHWTARIGQQPPLYPIMLHFWTALNGNSPYDLRLFSALLGAGAIPFIYLTGKRISGPVAGVAAAIFLAISPFNIRFAQETHTFTLLAFNICVAIYALVRLLTDSQSHRPLGSQLLECLRQRGSPIQAIETDLAWLGFILFTTAALFSHNSAVFFLLAINIFVPVLMLYQKISKSAPALHAPSLGNWLKAQAAILLLWSAWLPAILRQMEPASQDPWLVTPGVSNMVQAIHAYLNGSILTQPGQFQMMWLAYALVLCLGLLHFRKKLSYFISLAILFTLPVTCAWIVSTRSPGFSSQDLIWTTIPLFLVLGAGIAQLRYRFVIIAAIGIIGAHCLFSTSDYFRFMQKEDWDTAAGYVANFAEENDLILFNTARAQIPFDTYFYPYEKQYLIQVEKHGVPGEMFARGELDAQMADSDLPGLAALLDGHDRVWLVYSRATTTDPDGLIAQMLASKLILTRQRDFYGGQVRLYEAP